MADERKDIGRTDAPDRNPDPITGTPGSHPIGTGVGAAAGGAAGVAAGAAAGAAMGSVVPGPGNIVGGAVGAVVGAVAGGLAAKGSLKRSIRLKRTNTGATSTASVRTIGRVQITTNMLRRIDTDTRRLAATWGNPGTRWKRISNATGTTAAASRRWIGIEPVNPRAMRGIERPSASPARRTAEVTT